VFEIQSVLLKSLESKFGRAIARTTLALRQWQNPQNMHATAQQFMTFISQGR